MSRYEVTYPLGFEIESETPLTPEQLAAEFAELVYEWTEHGVQPNIDALTVKEVK